MKKKVTFLPDNLTIEVEAGENLLAAAAKAGLYIQASCGGDGVCGKCKIKVEQGEVAANKVMQLSTEEHAAGFRLACQSSITQDLVVSIPAAISKDGKALRAKPKTTRAISARSLDELIGTWQVSPPVEKRFLVLEPPTIADNIPDLQRLMRAIKKKCHDCAEPTYDHPELLMELPFILREANWQVTAIMLRGKRSEEPDRIIALEPGDTTGNLYGLAVDIGTTTVVVHLVDLSRYETVGTEAFLNPQAEAGHDVISRIHFTLENAQGLKILQHKILDALNNAINPEPDGRPRAGLS